MVDLRAALPLISLGLVLTDVSGFSTDFDEAPLKIMSFNLRTSLANDPCPQGCWSERKDRIQQMLAKYQPDFIGTQEGAPDQIAYFQDDLGYASIGECSGECRWNERDSIFYSPDRWELLENKTFALVRPRHKLGTHIFESLLSCSGG